MGSIHRGIPEQLALELADTYNLTTFIESGTHTGASSQFASQWFTGVHTIESEPHYYSIAKKKLKPYKNVQVYPGNSQQVLPIILERISDNCLFWLDAHWSRDLQGNKPDIVCPVLQELETIKYFMPAHIIMIDDARLFTGNHGWPHIDDITMSLGYAYDVEIQQDVIIAKVFR